MKVAALIARKGEKWECLACGSDVGAYAEKQAAIITSGGKVGKGKDAEQFDEIVLLTTTGIRKRRKL
jgi:hypothetical protein